MVMVPFDDRLGRSLRIAHDGRVAVEGGARRALHHVLGKGGRELDDAQLGARVARDRVLQVERRALVHARVRALHRVHAQHLAVDAHPTRHERYLRAVHVPRVEDVRARVARRLAVPLDLRADVDHLF